MRTIGMSDYTVGEDCFDELPGALAEYGGRDHRWQAGTGCSAAGHRGGA